jgi:hypothetical protein
MPTRKTPADTAAEPVPATTPKPARASRARASAAAATLPEIAAPSAVDASAAADGSPDSPAIHEDGAWIEADAVEVHQGAVGRVDTSELTVTQGAIGAARADRIDVQMGAIGAVMSRDLSITQGGAGSVLAQDVQVDQSFVRTLVAREVTFRKPSAALVVIAQRVSGDVRVLLDWRGALAFGAAFGLLSGLLRRARRGG